MIKYTILLKLISPASFYFFKVAPRKLYITYVLCIIYLLRSAGGDNASTYSVDKKQKDWITNSARRFYSGGKDSLFQTKAKLCLNYKFCHNFHFTVKSPNEPMLRVYNDGNHFYITALLGTANVASCHFPLNETLHLNLWIIMTALNIFLHRLWTLSSLGTETLC